MHRIDGPGHVANQWVEKDPGGGIPGTTFTSDFQNAVQEELAGVIEGAGISLSKPDNAQLFAAILSLGGAAENAVLNGLFDFWQPTGPVAGAFHDIDDTHGIVMLADQWGCSSGDSPGEATISRGTFPLGTIPPGMEKLGQPRHFLSFDQTTGSTATAPKLEQPIESVKTLAGRIVVMSFVARVTSGTLSVTPQLRQNYGVGGSPTADDLHVGSPVTITTSLQRFSFSATLDGLATKTLGTNAFTDGRSWLGFELLFPTGTTFTFEISDARIDLGTIPIPLWRSRTAELELLLRYFEKSGDVDDAVGLLSSNVQGAQGQDLWDANVNFPYHTVLYQVSKYQVGVFDTFSTNHTGSGNIWVEGSSVANALLGNGDTKSSHSVTADGGETPSSAQDRWKFNWYVFSPIFASFNLRGNF